MKSISLIILIVAVSCIQTSSSLNVKSATPKSLSDLLSYPFNGELASQSEPLVIEHHGYDQDGNKFYSKKVISTKILGDEGNMVSFLPMMPESFFPRDSSSNQFMNSLSKPMQKKTNGLLPQRSSLKNQLAEMLSATRDPFMSSMFSNSPWSAPSSNMMFPRMMPASMMSASPFMSYDNMDYMDYMDYDMPTASFVISFDSQPQPEMNWMTQSQVLPPFSSLMTPLDEAPVDRMLSNRISFGSDYPEMMSNQVSPFMNKPSSLFDMIMKSRSEENDNNAASYLSRIKNLSEEERQSELRQLEEKRDNLIRFMENQQEDAKKFIDILKSIKSKKPTESAPYNGVAESTLSLVASPISSVMIGGLDGEEKKMWQQSKDDAMLKKTIANEMMTPIWSSAWSPKFASSEFPLGENKMASQNEREGLFSDQSQTNLNMEENANDLLNKVFP